MGLSIDLAMREKIDSPKLSTQCKETQATSTSASVATSKLMGVSLVPPYPSTTTAASGITIVFYEILQSLVDSKRATKDLLKYSNQGSYSISPNLDIGQD